MTETQSSANLFAARHTRLAGEMQRRGLHGLALNPGPTLTYLTGLRFHLMERPVTALFVPGQPLLLTLPALEMRKLDALPFACQPFPFGEDPALWPDSFRAMLQTSAVQNGDIGVEPNRLRVLELRLLEAAAPGARFVSAEDCLAALRMCKDAGELAAMRKAVEIAQQALLATLPVIHPGVTERQIAAELTAQLLKAGSDSEFVFSPIVSGGPNSANPHASPSNRPLQAGDLLVIDWGAVYNGYVSDLTRTFAIGEPQPELAHIAQIVREANAAGRAAGKPGAAAQDVDRAARQVIEAAGYGEFFTHRTGHGIGLEGHEPPYMRAGNTLILAEGMTYTVEPGIYLPGRNGVRIEDNVVVTAAGAETLSSLPRQLRILPA